MSLAQINIIVSVMLLVGLLIGAFSLKERGDEQEHVLPEPKSSNAFAPLIMNILVIVLFFGALLVLFGYSLVP